MLAVSFFEEIYHGFVLDSIIKKSRLKNENRKPKYQLIFQNQRKQIQFRHLYKAEKSNSVNVKLSRKAKLRPFFGRILPFEMNVGHINTLTEIRK